MESWSNQVADLRCWDPAQVYIVEQNLWVDSRFQGNPDLFGKWGLINALKPCHLTELDTASIDEWFQPKPGPVSDWHELIHPLNLLVQRPQDQIIL